MTQLFRRWTALIATVLALTLAPAAHARVWVDFYSVQTSWLSLRSVHAFFTLKGTLDATGEKIDENYGFSAATSSPAVLWKSVKQAMLTEDQEYIDKANHHFRVSVDDATYRKIKREVKIWETSPDHRWHIENRNCVVFVGVIAEMTGLNVDYPDNMRRKPKTYLEHIAGMNPGVDRRRTK